MTPGPNKRQASDTSSTNFLRSVFGFDDADDFIPAPQLDAIFGSPTGRTLLPDQTSDIPTLIPGHPIEFDQDAAHGHGMPMLGPNKQRRL